MRAKGGTAEVPWRPKERGRGVPLGQSKSGVLTEGPGEGEKGSGGPDGGHPASDG